MPKKLEKGDIAKRAIKALFISVQLPLLICIFIPLFLFSKYFDVFVFSLSDILPYLVLFFVIESAILFLLLLLAPKKIYRIISAALMSITFLVLLQSFVLNGDVYSIDGINQGVGSLSTSKMAVNLAIWILTVVFAIILACLKDKRNILSKTAIILSLIIFNLSIVTGLSAEQNKNNIYMTSTEKSDSIKRDASHAILTTKNLGTVSSQSNIFYFCVDRLDEKFAEEALKQYPDLYDELDGFVWFQDHLSSYGHTFPAISCMLTNLKYDTNLPRAEYLNSVYLQDNALSQLHDNGYKINIYTESYSGFQDANNFPSYVENKAVTTSYSVQDKLMLTRDMLKLTTLFTMPFLTKTYVTTDVSMVNHGVDEYDADGNIKFCGYFDKYEDALNKPFEISGDKGFYFIHTEGCHSTYSAKDSASYTKRSFEYINKYLRFLKEQGLYDSATIIITADHGSPSNDWGKPKEESLTALFVKPAGKKCGGGIKISNAPTSHENIWATIFKSENITTEKDYGRSVFEIGEDEVLTRNFVWHTWARSLIEYRYEIVGSARNFENWKLVEQIQFDKTLMY